VFPINQDKVDAKTLPKERCLDSDSSPQIAQREIPRRMSSLLGGNTCA